MSSQEENDEFGVEWDDVGEEECEELFAETDDESNKQETDEATHPSTMLGQSDAGSSSEHSSVEEQGERKNNDNGNDDDFPEDNNWDTTAARPSWVAESQHSLQKPPPFTPSPTKIDKVEQLTPGNSRLASFSSDLKLRFSETSTVSQVSEASSVDMMNNPTGSLFPSDSKEQEEDDGFPRESAPWPGADSNHNKIDEEDDDEKQEAEGGDAFSSEMAVRPGTAPVKQLSKALSTTWMSFDDDKWDSSKHDGEEEQKVAASQRPQAQETAPVQRPTTKSPAKKKKKKQQFSLEAGLAKVSEKTKEPPTAPQEERNGGQQENEVISFWGEEEEGDEEETPLAKALKARPPDDRNNQERSPYDMPYAKSPKASYSQFASPPSSAKRTPGGNNNNNQGGGGWLQKGLGSALDMVTSVKLSNLPFTKPKDDDVILKEDNVEEVMEEEEEHDVVEVNMPVANNSKSAKRSMDVSAISEDSAFDSRRSRLAGDKPGAFPRADPHDAITQGITAPLVEGDGYDPVNVMVQKMNDQSTHENQSSKGGIKFAEEPKVTKKAFHIMPLFDMFIDLPHPETDSDSADFPTTFVGAPTEVEEDVGIQKDIRDSMQDITFLSFPEYDSALQVDRPAEDDEEIHRNAKTPREIPGFEHHTFTLKLQSGSLVYAHVRRYLPPHKSVIFRYDVGRRLGRAMVLFTRFPGGDDFFATVLKTLDSIASQHNSMLSVHIVRPQKWFLQHLYVKHHRLCAHYATNTEDRRGGPHIITLQGLEFADCLEYYSMVDSTHFFLPNNLLHSPLIPDMKTSFNCSVLPVFRCLGVVNSLRLFSALLSERRIILVSVSATRLDRSVRAAVAMLAHGMLNWSHICIPILPPDLWSILKSPDPYLVGIMSPLAYRLELTDRLGDVAIFNLDDNTLSAMGDQKLSKLVPDLCRSLSETMLQKRRIALPENVATERDMTALAILNSTSDFLAQDLVEILKSDKQTMNGTAVAVKNAAKKAKKVVKSTLQYFLGGGSNDEEGDQEVLEVKKSKKEKRMEADAIFIEGCRNEAGEEAARLAFVSFFLRMLGNKDGYVYATEDSDYNFDKEKFMRQRKERGDGGGSPMWHTLQNFCDTQMIRDWVKMREEQIRGLQPIPADAPLFWQCIYFLELKDIDFGILNVRSVARMMLQKRSVQQMLPSNVRRLAMAITSKRKFEGHLDDAISDLAELSRESASALYDVMSVVWLRTRDCKGLQWVHGYQAMKVLKEVLLHGPLAAVADATDGMQRIRTLAFRKSQGCEQISAEAMEIYNLLADRSRLFLRRRIAAEERRVHRDTDGSPLIRDTRFNLQTPFKDFHAGMNPALRPPEPRRRASLSSKRASLSSRLPHRLSITKHIMALDIDEEESIASFSNVLPGTARANRHNEFLHDTLHRPSNESASGSLGGDLATARRYVREIARKTQEDEKLRTRELVRRRDSNAMGVELLRKQFMLLKVAIYMGPIFYFFGNHEHFLTIVMFLWLSQQFQVFRAPIDSGTY